VGPTPEKALETTRLVSAALEKELRDIQVRESVNERYLIRAVQVESTDEARLRVSSRLRSLVAVLALGTFLLFVLVSIADAVGIKRAESKARRTQRRRAQDEQRPTGKEVVAGLESGPTAPTDEPRVVAGVPEIVGSAERARGNP
jgi:hypothetical protein